MIVSEDFIDMGPDEWAQRQDKKMTRVMLFCIAFAIVAVCVISWQRNAAYQAGAQAEYGRYLALRDAVADRYGEKAVIHLEKEAERAFYYIEGLDEKK